MPTVVSYTSAGLMKMTLVEIGSISTMDNSTLLHHASMAETLINAKIARKYSIPISGHVPLLETLATDLAIYNVLTSRITIKNDHPWFRRFKDSLTILNQIADGEISLITSSGEVLSGRDDVSEIWSNKKNNIPTFWEGAKEDQIMDSDKIDDGNDERGL